MFSHKVVTIILGVALWLYMRILFEVGFFELLFNIADQTLAYFFSDKCYVWDLRWKFIYFLFILWHNVLCDSNAPM